MTPQGHNQQNADCGKLYKKNTQFLQHINYKGGEKKERWRGNLHIKRDILINYNV